ncbi:DUF305 domain-containing protein [Sphaerisporangium sp. NPDC051017]|uniref:DUF305 domain-containing protein n=1 Tax=Sphaerisporangium sp. NPDC051017 TaxID=3154636 RepID=UPI0034151542
MRADGPARAWRAVLLTVPLLAALLSAGCGGTGTDPAAPPSPAATAPGSPAASAPAPSPAAAVATIPPGFNGTDVAWLQLMIPMDGQTLALLDMARARGTDTALKRLATRIKDSHTAELTGLRRLLARTGLPSTNVHEGHSMPGMVNADDLAELGRTAGAEFDRRFARRLREHLDQSVTVARGEQASGLNRDTKRLAAAIERLRATQRADLDGVTRP